MELLSPAGNMECLKTAVSHGADAVYLAGKSFGARSFAANFSKEELYDAIAYCHLRGVKAYVTVNTMVLDKEFGELDALLSVLADAGADAVIVQDLGVLRRVSEVCPDLPIHASTQMTVHNLAGVRALEKLGVTRVVLARELSAKAIRHIAQNCNAELEVFVHGAMCMSYSGQCLMSSVLGGRSGNRGKCAQPCRLGYRDKQGTERFYLSLKDMSLAEHLNELKDMGIVSLKIEGRMKGPDYVATVVDTYRRCLDEERIPTKREREAMDRVFFRGGFTDGYFVKKTGKEMFAFDKPDNPYLAQENPKIETQEKTVKVACNVTLSEDKKPQITLTGMGETVTYTGDTPLEPSRNHPATEEAVKTQSSKTGGTAFVFEPVTVRISGAPFAPVKVLNELRRGAIGMLEAKILAQSKKTAFVSNPEPVSQETYTMAWTASVRTKEQFDAICDLPFERVDVPLWVLSQTPEAFLSYKERVVVCPPVIVTDESFAEAEKELGKLREMGFSYLRAENIGWLSQTDWTLLGGHRLNVANTQSVIKLKQMGFAELCLSAELNLKQIEGIAKVLPTECLVYGHLPLMITENCVLNNTNACPCDGTGTLIDRKGKTFFVVKDGTDCRSVVLNSVPLYLADKRKDFKDTNLAYGRLLFTVESPKLARSIAKQYLGEAPAIPQGEFTRLHLYKGVL